MTIPDRILEQVEFVATYAAECDDWVTVKKEVMRGIPSSLRRNFSTRDPKTKEQSLNDFERDLIKYWKRKTGIDLKLRTRSERRQLFGIL